MAKVDILLPYWGDFKLLKEAVDSVIAQSVDDWRLVIIDDHDPSPQAQEYYSQYSDPRVEYYRNKKNIGITENFNFALTKTTSEYFIMLGCDDKMLPDYLKNALLKMQGVDFYQPGVEILDKDGYVYLPLADRIKRLLRPNKPGIYNGQKLAISLCNGNWLYFPSIMWRTSVVKKYGFNVNFKIVEDVLLETNIILGGGKLYLDNDITFQYRRFSESLSSKERRRNGVRFDEEKNAYNMISKQFKTMGWKKASLAAKMRITSRINRYLSKISL